MKHAPHWSDEPRDEIRYPVLAGFAVAIVAGMLGGALLTAWFIWAAGA